MAKKKQKSKAREVEKEYKAIVKKLRTQLAAAEKSAEKWRARAKTSKADAASRKSELTVVRRELVKAEASVEKWKGRAKSAAAAASTPDVVLTPVATPVPTPEPTPDLKPTPVLQAAAWPVTASTSPSVEPDDSWTVTRLRTEARARGIAGYSRKSKAQLLVDLRG